MKGQIYIDLDGVLADFNGHYHRLFGVKPSRLLPDPPNFWSNVHSVGTFFADLPLTPDGLWLWQAVLRVCPRPIVLTGLPFDDNAPVVEAQKRAWVQRHLRGLDGETPEVICTHRQRKGEHCTPGAVLIDDWVRYALIWEQRGGIFILHQSAKHSIDRLAQISTSALTLP